MNQTNNVPGYSLVVPSISPHGYMKSILPGNGPSRSQVLCVKCHLDSSARADGAAIFREIKRVLVHKGTSPVIKLLRSTWSKVLTMASICHATSLHPEHPRVSANQLLTPMLCSVNQRFTKTMY